MIIEITRGNDPAGLLAYLLGTAAALREGARLADVANLAAFETAATEMAHVAARSERVRAYVLHVSVSPAPDEVLDEAQWAQAWHRIDAELGMAAHQKVTVAHDDGRPHQHAGYNIVDPDTGRTPAHRWWDKAAKCHVDAPQRQRTADSRLERRAWDSNLKYRLQQVARDLEQELGLASAVAPERWRSRERSPRPSPGAAQQERRTGVAPLELEHGDAIRRALREPGWAAREQALHVAGIGMEAYAGANAKRKGIAFFLLADPARRCSGSRLGSDYGLGALERRAGETLAGYFAQRHPAALAPAPQTSRTPDPLYQRYLAYRAERQEAREVHRLRRLIAREQQKLEIAAEKRQQQAERSALRQAAQRRRGIVQRLRPVEQLLLEAMRARHRAELDERHPALPRTLTWTQWLTREAAAGDAVAQARLARPQHRSGRGIADQVASAAQAQASGRELTR